MALLTHHIQPLAFCWTRNFHRSLLTKNHHLLGQCELCKYFSSPSARLTRQAASVINLCLAPEVKGQAAAVLAAKTSSTSRRCMATQRDGREKKITKRSTGTGEVSIGKRVVQTGKDVSYMGIVIVGIGVTAIMFYAVGRELFASSSPNAVYTKAFKLCKKDDEIIEELGEPIKGFGETTRRGRRRHVSHLEYEQDGVKHMRMKFYMQGSKRKATVHLEVKKEESGRYKYRYLFVEFDGYPHRTVVLEDNR